MEIAYGPRAQLSIGASPEVVAWSQRRWLLGASALLATENVQSRTPLLAQETGRVLLSSFVSRYLYGRSEESEAHLSLSLGAGVERSWRASDAALEAPHPWDLPFGAGGAFTSVQLSWGLARGPIELRGALRERIYLPGWPLLFGARVVADQIGSALATGIAHAPAVELSLALPRAPASPAVSLWFETLVPLDDAARPAFFARAMAGPRLGRLWIFVSTDAGNGKGQLTLRREARLSLGVRLAFE